MRTAYMVVMFVVTGLCLINERVIQKYPEKKQQWTLLLVYALAITVLFTGLREYTDYFTSNDEYNYRQSFITIGETPIGSLLLQIEPLNKVITHLLYAVTGSAQFYLFFYAFTTCFIYFSVFKRFSANATLSIFLFFATGFLYRSTNIMRQCLAMAVVISSLNYIADKRFIPFLLYTVVAFFIHSSAIIMIPAYWIADSPMLSHRIKAMAAALFATFLLYRSLIRGIVSLLSSVFPRYVSGRYLPQLLEGGAGINIIRIFVALVPLILLFILRDDIERTTLNNFIANMCAIGFFLSFLSLRYLYFQRFVFYFSMFDMLLIPELVTITKKKSFQFGKITEFATFALYSCFVYYHLPATKPFSNYFFNLLNK